MYERQVFDSGSQYGKLHPHHCIVDFEFERFNQSSLGDNSLRGCIGVGGMGNREKGGKGSEGCVKYNRTLYCKIQLSH